MTKREMEMKIKELYSLILKHLAEGKKEEAQKVALKRLKLIQEYDRLHDKP